MRNSDNGFQVIHLSTSHGGGAGISARRLNVALIASGLSSTFVALESKKYELGNSEIAISKPKRYKIFRLLNTRLSMVFMKQTYFTFFSFSSISYKKLREFGPPKSTIFHIHNWFNLLSLRTIRKMLEGGYHLVFTLHDQRLFTGGCHYSLSCKRFTDNCSKCPLLPSPINRLPKWNLKRAQKLFSTFKNQVTIIAPSVWVCNLAQDSNILRNCTFFVVPNIHSGFMAGEKLTTLRLEEKRRLNLILGVANIDKSSPLKGGDLLPKLKHLINLNNLSVELKYLADFQISSSGSKLFWESIDYLLVISRADNSPNVIHEAKSIGIPVIGTRIGGISELLNADYDFIVDMNEDILEQLISVLNKILKGHRKIEMEKIIGGYKIYSSDALLKMQNIYASILS